MGSAVARVTLLRRRGGGSVSGGLGGVVGLRVASEDGPVRLLRHEIPVVGHGLIEDEVRDGVRHGGIGWRRRYG